MSREIYLAEHFRYILVLLYVKCYNKKEILTLQKFREVQSVNKEEMRFKQEQAEKVKSFKILNKSAIKGQVLFTGSSLMEGFPILDIAQNDGLNKIIYNHKKNIKKK